MPQVSVVVVVHNMEREAARTLYSLSAAYQRDIAPDDYEIIVVDNGSTPAFDPVIFEQLQGNFRLIRLFPAPSSPAHAINVGLAAARGDVIGVMIDGARIVTPGLLHYARTGVQMFPCAVVATLGWYLGYDQQRWGMTIRPSARPRPMRPTRPIRPARRPRITLCAPITTPSGWR